MKYVLYTGSEGYEYITAVFRGDTSTIDRLNKKFDAEREESKRKEYEKFKAEMSAEDFAVFMSIESHPKLKRDTIYHSYIGSEIRYSVVDFKLPDEEYLNFTYLVLRKGNYSVYSHICGDYSDWYYNIVTDCPPKFIMTVLNELK